MPGNFHSALAALADRATYFYSSGGRYWYDLQANISRRAKDLSVTIEIEATTADGFDEAKVRTVSENAATLKFEQSAFEEG